MKSFAAKRPIEIAYKVILNFRRIIMKSIHLILKSTLLPALAICLVTSSTHAQSISNVRLASGDTPTDQKYDFSKAAKDLVTFLQTTGSTTFALNQIFPSRAFKASEIYELHGYVDTLVHAGKISPQYAGQLHDGVRVLEQRYGRDLDSNFRITLPGRYRQAFVAGWFVPLLLIFIPVVVEVLNLP